MADTTAPGGRRELLDAALTAAGRGWRVFPLAPGAKYPAVPDHPAARCTRRDPRCRDGHTGWEARATTDPDRIRRAWTARPFNIGLACGPSGLLVVDLDRAKAGDVPPVGWAVQGVTCGMDVLILTADTAGEPPPVDTHTVTTPSGGTHLYFTAPAGVRLGNTAGDGGAGLGWRVDTRGHGGYVVAAGSLINGHAYVTTDPRDPIELPAWLTGALTPAPPTPAGPVRLAMQSRAERYLASAVAAEVARVEGAKRGDRNGALYIAARSLGQFVAGGALAEETARAVLEQASAGHLAVGAYSAAQMRSTITSGLQAGACRPRTIATAPAGRPSTTGGVAA
ncbi:MAG TPA: bifunctional DNA primase/polymerase [Pseudonocardiaceae bacterium]